MVLLSFIVSILSVINPIAAIPLFITLTTDRTGALTKIAIKCSLYVSVILVVAFFTGNHVLHFFGISLNSMKLSGGIVMFLSGLAFLTSKTHKHKGINKKITLEALEKEDISFTPLAMPMLAGPGSMSLLISYGQMYTAFYDRAIIVFSVAVVSTLTFMVLFSSKYIVKFIGNSGIVALSRIMGFFVMSIGVEYILSTLIILFK